MRKGFLNRGGADNNWNSPIYFVNFELHSFACEKNNARVIARNETGPSINRDAQLPVESPGKNNHRHAQKGL